MKDFSDYVISAWQESGLTIQTEPPVSPKNGYERRKIAWPTMLVVSALALGISMMEPRQALAQYAFSWQKGAKHAPVLTEENVAPGYWRALMSEMRQWRAADDKPLPDFDSPIG